MISRDGKVVKMIDKMYNFTDLLGMCFGWGSVGRSREGGETLMQL